MKLLTTNFLTCAIKACKSSSASFPLHFKDAVLERTEIEFNPLFMRNILPRVNWEALTVTATELGLQAMVPEKNPEQGGVQKEDGIDEDVLKNLHTLLLETGVSEGKLVCGNCGFEYPIKEGVGNFLLPAHLV
ncbi:uncharacterized protein A1O5_00605 [Cladophialophora psammophila CBS 110553]|uniref:Multifunctional methyltransferase subunit TRM112 n=1 Tax=Cladophialophora psammophila CBS 110553 TaxID=1182543 RepID=W9X6I9_9EURO|nr:uncharacterized protein A1O5_00605 [Cladophialophora psammophila CBS 110553]EXJ76097.1 hypothetical protein A1O5_00605 [Cladophialophora psammophila CBS 110553]